MLIGEIYLQVQLLWNKLHFEIFKEYELDKSNPSKLRNNSYKYLINHWDSIQLNFTKEKSVGCSQEGINSHYYASRLTTRPKGFHEASARVIAQLVNIRQNNDNFDFEIMEQIVKPVMKEVKTKQIKYPDEYIPPQGHFIDISNKKDTLRRISHPYIS